MKQFAGGLCLLMTLNGLACEGQFDNPSDGPLVTNVQQAINGRARRRRRMGPAPVMPALPTPNTTFTPPTRPPTMPVDGPIVDNNIARLPTLYRETWDNPDAPFPEKFPHAFNVYYDPDTGLIVHLGVLTDPTILARVEAAPATIDAEGQLLHVDLSDVPPTISETIAESLEAAFPPAPTPRPPVTPTPVEPMLFLPPLIPTGGY